MAVTLTPSLKLRVNSNLTADAKYNLYRIDSLSSVYYLDASGNVNIRSAEDITIQPQDTGVGGTAGGQVNLATSAAPADAVNLWAAETYVSGNLSLADSAPSGSAKLSFSYNSTLSGVVDPTDRTLGIDVQGGDRQLILGADLVLTTPSPTGGSLTFALSGPTTLSLPTAGTLVTDSAVQTLTNKTIDANTNTLLNINVGNFAAGIQIPYSDLNLSGSIVNADVNSSAAIAYSKLNLSNSIINTDISSSAAIGYGKLNLAGSITNADVSGSAAIAYSKLSLTSSILNSDISPLAAISRAKLAVGAANAVLVNDGSGFVSETSILDSGRGGTGVSGTAVFPISGNVTTDVNVQSFQNKTIDGNTNTFANVPYSSLNLALQIKNSDISNTAAIAYSKLNLSGSIKDSDVSASAAIQGTKIVPSFGAQIIKTDDMIQQHGLATGFTLSLQVSPFQSVDYTWTYPTSPGINGQVLTTDGAGALAWSTIAGSGTVTSVGFSAPNDLFTVGGAPITTNGTISLTKVDQSANTVYSGPISGADDAPAFRLLDVLDLPSGIPADNIADGSVSNTEFQYLDGVTSSIQSQLDGKQPLDGDLSALAALSGTGFAARTAANTWALRTAQAGTGISITNPAGIAGDPTFSNTAPDQIVSLMAGTGISTSGTYPNFTITNTSPDQTVTLTAGAGISITGSYPNFTIDSTITQYTDEMAQDAVGGILLDSADITFTYDDSTPSISAVLTDTGVSPATYGSAAAAPVITVDAKGRISAVTGTPISITSFQVTDFVEAAQDATGAMAANSSSVSLTYVDATPSLTADLTPGSMTAKTVPIGADLVVIGDSAASFAPKTVTITALSTAIAPQSFKASWVTADGTTKVITHNLGSLDVIVQLYDTVVGDTIYVDTAVRTDANTLTLTSSQTPSTSWRVLILKV